MYISFCGVYLSWCGGHGRTKHNADKDNLDGPEHHGLQISQNWICKKKNDEVEEDGDENINQTWETENKNNDTHIEKLMLYWIQYNDSLKYKVGCFWRFSYVYTIN